MFAFETVKLDALVSHYLLDLECTLFLAFARHYFGPESNKHFGPGPNIFLGNGFLFFAFKERHN